MERKFNDFRDMSVWQKAFVLLKEVYEIIKKFPDIEKYALTEDLRRAANSVCHNIAEGYGRFEPKDKSRLYKIARGSSFEAMSQLLVAESQSYISEEVCNKMILSYKEVVEEINHLINKIDK